MEQAKQLMEMVAKYESLIYDTADYIWKNPETGYREWKTSAYMEEHFEALGYTLTKAGNIPGFYADLDTGRPGPKIAILGELDSLIVGNHPDADPETHAAVPAEELIELGFREELRKQGVIRYFGGKVEFISRGYFDGVDMAMMIHSGKLPEGKTLSVGQGCNGCITKNITFKGVASHAGGSPEAGKNALYAATCGLNAVNAIRETFVDGEHIRFHPIITEGGAAVNAIPETAKVESYVRGASFDSIRDYNKKVNLALAGAAASLGCNVELDDHPGYFPLNNDTNMTEILTEAMEAVTGPGTVTRGAWGTGCTDMGDVSAIMPAIHPHASGSIGTGHGKDYYVADKKAGCLYPAQCLTVAASMLLENDAARAKKVLAEAKPYFKSKEEYLAAIDNLTMDKDAVIYNEDGTVTLDFCQR